MGKNNQGTPKLLMYLGCGDEHPRPDFSAVRQAKFKLAKKVQRLSRDGKESENDSPMLKDLRENQKNANNLLEKITNDNELTQYYLKHDKKNDTADHSSLFYNWADTYLNLDKLNPDKQAINRAKDAMLDKLLEDPERFKKLVCTPCRFKSLIAVIFCIPTELEPPTPKPKPKALKSAPVKQVKSWFNDSPSSSSTSKAVVIPQNNTIPITDAQWKNITLQETKVLYAKCDNNRTKLIKRISELLEESAYSKTFIPTIIELGHFFDLLPIDHYKTVLDAIFFNPDTFSRIFPWSSLGEVDSSNQALVPQPKPEATAATEKIFNALKKYKVNESLDLAEEEKIRMEAFIESRYHCLFLETLLNSGRVLRSAFFEQQYNDYVNERHESDGFHCLFNVLLKKLETRRLLFEYSSACRSQFLMSLTNVLHASKFTSTLGYEEAFFFLNSCSLEEISDVKKREGSGAHKDPIENFKLFYQSLPKEFSHKYADSWQKALATFIKPTDIDYILPCLNARSSYAKAFILKLNPSNLNPLIGDQFCKALFEPILNILTKNDLDPDSKIRFILGIDPLILKPWGKYLVETFDLDTLKEDILERQVFYNVFAKLELQKEIIGRINTIGEFINVLKTLENKEKYAKEKYADGAKLCITLVYKELIASGKNLQAMTDDERKQIAVLISDSAAISEPLLTHLDSVESDSHLNTPDSGETSSTSSGLSRAPQNQNKTTIMSQDECKGSIKEPVDHPASSSPNQVEIAADKKKLIPVVSPSVSKTSPQPVIPLNVKTANSGMQVSSGSQSPNVLLDAQNGKEQDSQDSPNNGNFRPPFSQPIRWLTWLWNKLLSSIGASFNKLFSQKKDAPQSEEAAATQPQIQPKATDELVSAVVVIKSAPPPPPPHPIDVPSASNNPHMQI